MEEVPAAVSTPVKNDAIDTEISTVLTTGSSLLRSTVGSPGAMSLKKLNFKDMLAAEFEGVKEKY